MQRQDQERQQQQQTDASSGHDTITHADLLNHMAMMNETTSNGDDERDDEISCRALWMPGLRR